MPLSQKRKGANADIIIFLRKAVSFEVQILAAFAARTSPVETTRILLLRQTLPRRFGNPDFAFAVRSLLLQFPIRPLPFGPGLCYFAGLNLYLNNLPTGVPARLPERITAITVPTPICAMFHGISIAAVCALP